MKFLNTYSFDHKMNNFVVFNHTPKLGCRSQGRIWLWVIALLVISCKKSDVNSGKNTDTTDTSKNNNSNSIPTPNSIGFFLDSWQAKTYTTPTAVDIVKATGANQVNVSVDFSGTISNISKYIFGNNSTPYMTQFLPEATLMNNLKKLSPNILRFPGGSLSDLYFWNALPNQFPADAPSQLLDKNGNAIPAGYWAGNNSQAWTLTLDNYYKVLEQTHSTGLITVNYEYARYGTGLHPVQTAAHLAADWVRYDHGRTKYWEIGNECYGFWETGYRINPKTNKDGQPEIISGSLYGDHFKIFVDSMQKAAKEINATIKIGGILLSQPFYGSVETTWDAGFLPNGGSMADFFIFHHYYAPFGQNSIPITVLNSATQETKLVVNDYNSFMTTYKVPLKPIALTEWNINSEGSMQKVSNIAGLHSSIVLGELLKNEVGMATRWDLANAWNNGDDHGLFDNGDEPGGSRWNPRPTFYYMYYFQKQLGDRFINSSVQNDTTILSYASAFGSGETGITLINKGLSDKVVNINITNFAPSGNAKYYYYTLNGGTDNGGFSRFVYVNGKTNTGVSGGPVNYDQLPAYSTPISGGIVVKVPSYGAVFLVATKK